MSKKGKITTIDMPRSGLVKAASIHDAIHKWVHLGKNDKPDIECGNVKSEGHVIYSYGRHFPMGRAIFRKGRKIFFVTTRSYSSTTAGHVSALHGSIPSENKIFHVNNVMASPGQQRKDLQGQIDSTMKSARKATSYKGIHLDEVVRKVCQANDFAEVFGLKWEFACPEDYSVEQEKWEDWQRKSPEREALKAKRALERQAEELEAAKEKIGAWRRGEIHVLPRVLKFALLRKADGGMMQTSQGARVPEVEAARAARLLKRLRERGEELEEPFRVGSFTVQSISPEGVVTVGCHLFEWAEIESVGIQLGWLAAS